MNLMQQIDADYITAAKERNTEKIGVLRLMKSALKNEAIKIGGLGYELTEQESIAVLNREAKQRREAISQYEAAGRDDLAATEEAELAIIETYLPKALSDDDLAALVDSVLQETGATQKSDMGKVMGALKAKLENPADVSRAAAIINTRLG